MTSLKETPIRINLPSQKMSASAKIRAEAEKKASAKPKSQGIYLDFYRDNCNSLDAKTFTQIRQQIVKFMKDDKCPSEVKILFGDWIFRKIYMYFKMRDDIKEELCENLHPAIDKCKNMTVKGEYLSFHDNDAISNICLNFYLNRFSEKDKFFILQMLNDVQLVKNYVQDPRISDEGLKDHFVEWLKKSNVFEQQSNLLDVLLRYYPRDKEVSQIYNKMRFGNKGKGSLYQDDQNVHDTDIQSSLMIVCGKLLEWDEKIGSIEIPLMANFRKFSSDLLFTFCRNEKERKIANCVVERMCIDHTSFNTVVNEKNRTFSISDIFLAVMNYIMRSPSKKDLIDPLHEELEAMSELCSSGYPTHFINILRGFDDRFEINITFSKQLYAAISHVLHQKLENAPENIVLGSFEEEHKREYIDFVANIVNDIVPRLNSDYGESDVRNELANTLKEITDFSGWRISEDNKVSYEFSEKEE